MATEKREEIVGSTKEKEEQVSERERDVNISVLSKMCHDHGRVIDRKPTTTTTDACNFDDGSGDTAEKCPDINQQADHYRSTK